MNAEPRTAVRKWSDVCYAAYVDGRLVDTAQTREEAQREAERRCEIRESATEGT